MTELREDLIQSAVKFLVDPKVRESTLTKKIAFLESKGLSTAEIEESVRRSSGLVAGLSGQNQSSIAHNPVQSISPSQFAQPQSQPGFNWKDYTLAVLSILGVGYGTYTVVKQYILPQLAWPTATEFEADSNKLNSSLTTTTSALQSVQNETTALAKSIDDYSLQVSNQIDLMSKALVDLKEMDEKRDEEIAKIKLEVDGIKEMIPK
ncbi:peroxisomal membrane protein pex14, partial [Nowakowskiella sp. JEL0078]